MKPTVQQQKVIDSTEKDILVEAGAGSGKTTTTVKRYMRLLRDGIKPENILAITFTDKAAGELREKVRVARRELARQGGDTNPQSFTMSTSWVGTFHSICTRILRAFPVEAGIDPKFSVLDDINGETVRNDAFNRAMERFLQADASRVEMVALFTEKTLRDTVSFAYDELRSRGMSAPDLPLPAVPRHPTDALEYLALHAGAISEQTSTHKNHRPKAAAIAKLLSDKDHNEIRYRDLAPFVFKSKGAKVIEFSNRLNTALCDLAVREMGDQTMSGIAELLRFYGEEFATLKEQRSELDYEDLQLRTLELLRDKSWIRDSYRSRFAEIMVDEFQDTNQLQIDLINELRDPETTLYTVGDEMQSIYGFRHADVELFRSRRDDDRVTVLKLTDNFRSQPDVIAAVNEIGRQLDNQVKSKRGTESKVGRHEFKELTMGLEATEAASTQLLLTDHDGWKPLDMGKLAPSIPDHLKVGKKQDHFHQAEALDLAQRLALMVESGEVRQGDITILLRAKTWTALYVDALKQVGLDPYVVSGSGFWKSREGVDMTSLLSVVANPLDDDSLLGALTSPACGASSDAIWLLRRMAPDYEPVWPTLKLVANGLGGQVSNHEWFEHLPEPDLRILTEFVTQIEAIRSRAPSLGLDELAGELVTMTGYDLANLRRENSGDGLANVRRVISLAHDFEASRGRDLRGFLDWIAISSEIDSEAAVATEEEDSDVVRIMTVHAAKGLEFKAVCVPECGRLNQSRQDHPLILGRAVDPDRPGDFPIGLRLPVIGGGKVELYDWEQLCAAAKLQNEDEELRLFHVALTRAQNHLIVSGILPEKEIKSISDSRPMISRIAYAYDINPEDPDSFPEAVPRSGEDAQIAAFHNEATQERADELSVAGESRAEEELEISGAPPLSRPHFPVYPNVPLSFTALNLFVECPARFYASRVLRLDDDQEDSTTFDPERQSLIDPDRATRFGSAVHDILEKLANRRWPRELDRNLVTDCLSARGFDPDDSERIGLATRFVEGFLGSDLGFRVREVENSAELPLIIRVGGVTIRGFADLILDSEPPMVLDYKTNRLDGRTPAQKMGSYELQRDLYSLAVARSSGSGTVESAFVFLEEPNNPVLETFDAAGVADAEARVEDTLTDITEGRFFGGPQAVNKPCGQCWACETLSVQRERALAG